MEAERTHPALWDEVKREITDGGKGGKPGQWSARKAQMAVQEYKRRGGGYDDSGPAQDETHLHQWTEEDWGTRSGGQSGETGERYLPREVRMILTEAEYARSTRAKRDGSGQYVRQPDDIARKATHIREHGPTVEMLAERARDLGIEGRSTMGREALLSAIRAATDRRGHPKDSRRALAAKGKAALYRLAQERDVSGRSKMTRDELVEALAAR